MNVSLILEKNGRVWELIYKNKHKKKVIKEKKNTMNDILLRVFLKDTFFLFFSISLSTCL